MSGQPLYSGQISWSQCVLYREVPLYTYIPAVVIIEFCSAYVHALQVHINVVREGGQQGGFHLQPHLGELQRTARTKQLRRASTNIGHFRRAQKLLSSRNLDNLTPNGQLLTCQILKTK